MNITQIVSLVATILLTSVSLVVGIQLILVLKELRNSLTRVNKTLDVAGETLEKLSQPAVGFFALIEGFRQSGKIIETISHLLGRDKGKAPVDLDTYDSI